VYQVNVGMPSPTFLAFVPMRTLAQNDDLLNLRDLLHEAEGEAAERMQQMARAVYAHTESNLYAISPPEKSHVSKGSAAASAVKQYGGFSDKSRVLRLVTRKNCTLLPLTVPLANC
jgi:hypothetical protein